MDQDTDIAGPGSRFPTTRRSAVLATRSGDALERGRAFETLVAAYWKPVYKYVRCKWGEGNEDAKDLTQGFFARAIEKRFFEAYDPAKAAFRTYLRVCLDGFVANEKKAARRQKRFPGAEPLSLDFEEAEREMTLEPASPRLSMEDYFHGEWVRSLFSLAVERLRDLCAARGKETAFSMFELYDLEEGEPGARVTYQSLAEQFQLPVTTSEPPATWRRSSRRGAPT